MTHLSQIVKCVKTVNTVAVQLGRSLLNSTRGIIGLKVAYTTFSEPLWGIRMKVVFLTKSRMRGIPDKISYLSRTSRQIFLDEKKNHFGFRTELNCQIMYGVPSRMTPLCRNEISSWLTNHYSVFINNFMKFICQIYEFEKGPVYICTVNCYIISVSHFYSTICITI